MFSFSKPAISAITTLASMVSLVFCGSVLTHQGPAQAQTYLPAYTTSASVGAFTPTNVPSSFGLFFDSQTTDPLDALGFASQQLWGNGKSYEVKLWYFNNAGANVSDYTEVASTTFTHGISYPFQDGYFWKALGPIPLLDTFTNDPNNLEGYVISAIGDFSNSPGNVQFEGGTASFNSRFVPSVPLNGFNEDGFAFYPIPIYDGGVGQNGYFNANLSTVPGPLPVLGAAAGFSWTRRLRKRIRSSKQ